MSSQPVKDLLRGAGEALTGQFREDMEARLGAGLADVRIHTDSAAHQAAQAVSARAFTAGSHIAFQRGQYDPASAAGRQTLAHELAHVIQQRSGPVAGTDAGNGIRVSDPSDSFERAAEATAQRAMAGDVRSAASRAPAAEAAARPVTPVGEAVPVQRKVGFEFEVVDDKSSVSRVKADGSLAKKKDSKKALKYLNDSGGFSNNKSQKAYLAADNGNVEYITDPLKDRDEVKTAVGAITKFHAASGERERITPIARALDGGRYQVKLKKGGPHMGRPQATIGLRIADILTLFGQLNEWSKEKAPGPSSQNTRSAEKKAKTDGAKRASEQKRAELAVLRQRVADQASINTDLAVDRANQILAAMQPVPGGTAAVKSANEQEALGFIAIILKTAIDVGNNGKQVDDPKYYLSLMPRTDFISMLHSLKPATRSWLKKKLLLAMRGVAGGNEFLDQGIMASYKANSGKVYTGSEVTGEQWLRSILEGAPGEKDKLSPPPGYEPHKDRIAKRQEPEGIGAKETDGPLSLFEFRGFTASGAGNKLDPLPVEAWLPLALVVCDLVAEVTGDEAFAPDENEIGYESEPGESESEADEESKAETKGPLTRSRSGGRKRSRS